MKRIAVYIRAKDVSPSGYYRVLQYTNRLNANFYIHNILPPVYYKFYLKHNKNRLCKYGLYLLTYIFMYLRVCTFLAQDIVHGVDGVIVSRGLLPRCLLFPAKQLFTRLLNKAELLWDFDDDILYSKEISRKEFDFLSAKSKNIFVTHEYLARKVSSVFASKIIIMPTTDGDFKDAYSAQNIEVRKKAFVKELRLVWIGSAVNLSHLNAAIPALDVVACQLQQKCGKQLVLNVCSSVPLKAETGSLCVKNVKWDRQVAIDLVSESHIGIMPLLPTEYALGKGSFKLVQYMAAGLPVIGSSVGFNKEVVDDTIGHLVESISDSKEWGAAVETIAKDWNAYSNFSKCSLSKWQKSYSYDSNLQVWKKYLGI